MRIGFVTIGQGPREDLVDVFQQRVGVGNELLLVGALDGLTDEAIADLAPDGDEEPLVTQVRSGESVTIAKERILDLMQTRIGELEARDVEFIVVLCTGPFPELTATVPLLLPDAVLRHFVQGVMPEGHLGVIAPLVAQQPMMREKWHDYPGLTLEALDPYGNLTSLDGLNSFEDCGLVVLDCMGYSPATRRLVGEHTRKPVILAQDVLAHAVELLAQS